MAINTGSSSFMSRLGGQLPGMVNAAAQQFGNPSMRGSVAGSASLLKKQQSPKFGGGTRRAAPPITSGIPAGQMPGQQMPLPTGMTNIQAPGLQQAMPEINAQMPVDTGPTNSSLFMNPYANIFNSSPGYGRSGNTGIAGGLFNRPPGYERPNMGAPGTDIGGLFGRFNQLTQPGMRY